MIGAIVIGVAGGVIAGMLGVGGGIVFVPGLTLFLSLSQVDAEATSLLAIVPVAAVGAWSQYRYGNVRLRDGLSIGALSALGAIGGASLSNVVSERALRIAFAVLTLAIAAQLVYRALRDPDARVDASARASSSRDGPNRNP